jgi:hypothetical protein
MVMAFVFALFVAYLTMSINSFGGVLWIGTESCVFLGFLIQVNFFEFLLTFLSFLSFFEVLKTDLSFLSFSSFIELF